MTAFPSSSACALILAAGKGTRMHSPKPKVLQTLLGEPLLAHVLAAVRPLFGDAVWAVIGHEAAMVRSAFAESSGLGPIRFVEQTEQLGTGHALKTALPALRKAGMTTVLVLNGDTPLIPTATLERFVREAEGSDVAVATLDLEDPGSYGRIVRRHERLTAIVEAKEYDPERDGVATGEVNAGIYLFRIETAESLIEHLGNANKSGEYYITDLVDLAVRADKDVRAIRCGADLNLMGINTPAELSRSEEQLREKRVRERLEAGVILHNPDAVRIGPFAVVEPGAEITGPCELYGSTTVACGAVIESHCRIKNSRIASKAVVHAFSHLEHAEVGPSCLVGPYARLRPGAVLEAQAHVGNFVEMKKARLGEGAKANHLTYLGDAEIGAHSNIGAGTITCNYDGVNKHRTTIGEHAFIGSNTSLVAPVAVGDGALVGAGSVITRNVPDAMLGVARGKQVVLRRCGVGSVTSEPKKK